MVPPLLLKPTCICACQKGQQKDSTLKKTIELCPSGSYYSFVAGATPGHPASGGQSGRRPGQGGDCHGCPA